MKIYRATSDIGCIASIREERENARSREGRRRRRAGRRGKEEVEVGDKTGGEGDKEGRGGSWGSDMLIYQEYTPHVATGLS